MKYKSSFLIFAIMFSFLFLFPLIHAGKGGSSSGSTKVDLTKLEEKNWVLDIATGGSRYNTNNNQRTAIIVKENVDGVEKEVCKALNSSGYKSYFIPTKTLSEWVAFKIFADKSSITIDECLSTLLDDLSKRAEAVCLEEGVPCGPVINKIQSIAMVSTSFSDFEDRLKQVINFPPSGEEYLSAVMAISFYSHDLELSGNRVNNLVTFLNDNFCSKYGLPAISIDQFPLSKTPTIWLSWSREDLYHYLGASGLTLFDQLDFLTILDTLQEESLKFENDKSMMNYAIEDKRNALHQIILEICGGYYCNIDTNGDNTCSIGEPCAGDMSSAGDNDGDGVCETGESCCAGDPEGCNLPGDYIISNGRYNYLSITDKRDLASITRVDQVWNCFLEGTLIETPTGEKDITLLKEGDSVISYNLENNNFIISKINQSITHRLSVNWYYSIKTKDSEVSVTGIHPFYVGNEQYKTAEDLKIGDLIYLNINNKLISEPILSKGVVSLDHYITVYNLELEENSPRNYFANGYLVHNKDIV